MTKKDWKNVEQSSSFQELIRQKKAFIIPATIFFIIFYFTLPILTAYTTILNGKAIGVINWAYIYAFAQFAMTWILCHMYMSKANHFDKLVDEVKKSASEKGVKAG
ncbi:DUF485 domain-containing protein [Brevibacillus sp. SYSU BS000544]|uniref:DUF485 domain-containing protein n=1 Tax=Brevibacillus sp. SYSU BS000544 TaxID=3416443 RepID=UPI003CE5A4D3